MTICELVTAIVIYSFLLIVSFLIVKHMLKPDIEKYITYNIHMGWISDMAKPLSWLIATIEYSVVVAIIVLAFSGMYWVATVGQTIRLW